MRQIRRLLIVLAAIVAFALPAFAQNPTSEVDQLLDLLVMKNVITSTEASAFRATLKKTALPSSNSVVAQAPTAQSAAAEQSVNDQIATRTLGLKNEELNINGFVQGRFTEAPGTTNTFEIRRARLIFDGKLTDAIGYQVQLDGVKPQLLDAKIDFNPAHQFGVTIGQFKIPFSTESYTSDNLLSFVERSTVVNSFAPGRDNSSNARDIGIQFLGKILRFRGADRVEYFAGVFNGAGINTKDDNHYKDTAARLILRPLKQVALVGNYYSGATGIKELGRERADLEVNFRQGPISASAEYIWGHDGPIHRHGWYAQSGYRASKHWEALFRFDKFDPRQHTATLTAVNNYVIGTNYFLNSYVKLQANYDRQHDLIARRSANVVLLQTQFQFGGEKVKQ
jgi:phosphate-selective porin OprO and OprP